MRKSILIGLLSVLLVACGGNARKNKEQANDTKALITDTSMVNVYYFHGKQRCKTCVTVEEVTKQTVQNAFPENSNVQFVEVNTSNKQNEALAEKYEITWNALIIAKDDDFIDLTEQAFATAVNNPEALSELIVKEVNNRLN